MNKKNLKIVSCLSIIAIAFSGCSNNEKNDISSKNVYNEIEIIENIELSENVEVEDEKTEIVAELVEVEKTNNETETIPVSASELSNKTCAWGFRRMKDGARPEFSLSYTKPLDAYDGIYCGNPDEKVIYLTFDEGYENGYTGAILDTLKEKEVTAIFFVTKPYVKQNPELVQRMIDEGHLVGNHTVNHPSMPEVTDDEKLKQEIMGLHDYMKENFNYEMTYLRPPKGEYSERTAKICKDLGYVNVLWSAAYDDWDTKKQDRLDYARGMILNNVHNGCVMLLHAVSKDNTALLGEVIDKIQADGYEFKSLDEFKY